METTKKKYTRKKYAGNNNLYQKTLLNFYNFFDIF